MLSWTVGLVTCASRCICFDEYSGKALFWLIPLLASRLFVLGSLELAYKLSHTLMRVRTLPSESSP